jgi:hypothetical protein
MEVAEHIAGHPPLSARLACESLKQGLDLPDLSDAALRDLYRFLAVRAAVDDDVRAARGELENDRAPDVAAGSCHQDRLAREVQFLVHPILRSG